MTNKKDYSRGFKYVGMLEFIIQQRKQQQYYISTTVFDSVLSVGCGNLSEISIILQDILIDKKEIDLIAVDISSVFNGFYFNNLQTLLSHRFSWHQIDIMAIDMLNGYGGFDVIQCSFLLHDIQYAEKYFALKKLSEACSPSGHIIISDFFLKDPHNIEEVTALYDALILECVNARSSGRLKQWQYKLLLGNDKNPGVLSSKSDALAGKEYYDTIEDFSHRVELCNLTIESIWSNPYNDWAKVLLLKRSCS